MLQDVRARLDEHGVVIELTDAAKDWLTESGFDHTYGARPLRRAIQQHIENPLSLGIISRDYTEGDTVQVDAGDDGLSFSKTVGPAGRSGITVNKARTQPWRLLAQKDGLVTRESVLSHLEIIVLY